MTFDVYPNDGDTITENRETRSRARSNSSEYVERGLGITLNGDGTFDVGAGFAIVRDGTDAWEVEDETGTTGVSLADTTTTNYIYLTFDPTASDVEGSAGYHVDTDQTPPTTPSLFIATADESTSSVVEKNRNPLLGANEVSGGVTSSPITNFEGNALSVDGNGNLNASGLAATVIDSGSTTAYTTQGEDVIYVDTSSAGVTITLASGDATQGNEIRIVNIDATNPVTVDTEGTETIDPGAAASKSIGKAGWSVAFTSDGANWDSSLAAEFESVSAADIYGVEGTAVDYANPAWQARTGAITHRYRGETLDGYNQVTSGSGTLSLDAVWGAVLDTGTTSGSEAKMFDNHGNSIRDYSWNKDRSIFLTVEILDAVSSRVDYYGDGRLDAGAEGVCVKVDGGSLLGAVHNGSSETTTTLISSLSTGVYDVRIEFTAGGEVEFYVNDLSTVDGTISSGLPSGTAQAKKTALARVTNTSGVQRRSYLSDYRMVQHP